MDFLNREAELETLNREYYQSRFSFVVVYGRRRVGKTRLLLEFTRGKKSVMFTADTQTEAFIFPYSGDIEMGQIKHVHSWE